MDLVKIIETLGIGIGMAVAFVYFAYRGLEQATKMIEAEANRCAEDRKMHREEMAVQSKAHEKDREAFLDTIRLILDRLDEDSEEDEEDMGEKT